MDNSSKTCDHLLQSIDDEINSLEESTRALKSRLNELVPFSRLHPENLVSIFFFLSLSTWHDRPEKLVWREKTGVMAWVCVTHVCRRWRETALNNPRFWSRIDLTKLTPVGMAEILARAKTAPLHLEADITEWSTERIVAFEKQLETHISHTRYLSISGRRLPILLDKLVSSAPILESLSLSTKCPIIGSSSPQAIIPDDLFNRTTPNLTNLELEYCDISWMSPFLKGLRTLQISSLFSEARPKLDDWLDVLNEMPQLEELSLQYSTPLAPLNGALIREPSHSATLPSLTRFHISDSSKECALAFAHLVLPAFTRLHVDVESKDWNREDVRLVIPYVVRNICGTHDIEPLRSILFSGQGKRAQVVAWTMPDADVNVRNPATLLSESVSARLMFTATGNWNHEVETQIYDDLLTLLPETSVSTFSALNRTRLSKDFWLKQATRFALLERVCLIPSAVKAFRDMLAEEAPPDGPRLPLLTKLTIIYLTWTLSKIYHFRDMLMERVEQGAPVECLDLRGCEEPNPFRAKQIFAEIVVDVQGPLASTWDVRIGSRMGLKSGSHEEIEYRDDSDLESWYTLDYPVEEVYDDY